MPKKPARKVGLNPFESTLRADDLRKTALHHAVCLPGSGDAAHIVKSAESFLKFLQG